MVKLSQKHFTIAGCAFFSIAIFIWVPKRLSDQKRIGPNHPGSARPTIFAITPTYARLVQKAELTQLANTFLHLQEFHWIVVEDSANKTQLVTSFLQNSGLQFTHLCAKSNKQNKISKGVLQRNMGLLWLRETFAFNQSVRGVVYFADDDNVYSLEIFEEMRNTKKVSVWPVAFAGGLRYESMDVDASGKVKGWKVKFAPERKFAIDMAGFAINLDLILEKRDVWFQEHHTGGYLETRLLERLVTLEDLEPKAQKCTKVLVWHTRTENPDLTSDKGYTDLNIEV